MIMAWCRHCGEDIQMDGLGPWEAIEPWAGGTVCTSSPDGLHHPHRNPEQEVSPEPNLDTTPGCNEWR